MCASQVERDLEKTETAFADLHAKYQKAKQVVENYKMNEATLRDAVEKGQLAVNVAEGRWVGTERRARSGTQSRLDTWRAKQASSLESVIAHARFSPFCLIRTAHHQVLITGWVRSTWLL